MTTTSNPFRPKPPAGEIVNPHVMEHVPEPRPSYFDWLYQQQRRENLEQKPSIGRIVVYRGSQSNGTNEHPAIINRVWSDDMVNLCIFPDCGKVGVQTSIHRIDPASDEKVGWFWPPRV